MTERLSAGSYDLALVAYAMDVCPDPGFMLMRGNTGNYCRYRSDTMTELSSPAPPDHPGAVRTCCQIQRQFADDCPFICLYYRAGASTDGKMYTTAQDVRELDLLGAFPRSMRNNRPVAALNHGIWEGVCPWERSTR